jgi:hypothetical protein
MDQHGAASKALMGVKSTCVIPGRAEREPGTQMARSLRMVLAIWVPARPAGDRNDGGAITTP